nr:matrixin family metalloprotease [Companilactobacillus metriopterae]
MGAWETSGFLNFVTTSDPDSAQIVYTSSTAEITDDLAGETMLSYYPSGNAYQIISSEISLSYNGETQTTEDMVHTATHETGHALGLDDETDPSLETTSVMYYQLTDHSSDLGYSLHDYDLQKLYSLYFPGAKYNDNISNNTFVRTTKWDSAIVNKDSKKVGVVPAYSSWAVKTGYLNIETNTSYYQVGNNQYISENDLY